MKKKTLNSFILLFSIIFSLSIFTECKRSASENGPGTQKNTQEALKSRSLGLAFLEENKLEEAEKEFLNLTKLMPEEAIGYANLGLVYMRMGNYDLAIENLEKAKKIKPDDPDIRLNLAIVYKYMNQQEKSLNELLSSIEIDSAHVESLYALAELYSLSSNDSSNAQYENFLRKTVAASPSNIVPRLYLIETLVRKKKPDDALQNLEEIQTIFPELPGEARKHYIQAIEALQADNLEDALSSVLIFHNYLKPTNPYHNGVTELKGYEGTSVGVPIFSFSNNNQSKLMSQTSILESISFQDISESAGMGITYSSTESSSNKEMLQSHIAIGDYDHDGIQDLYVGTYVANESNYRHFLLKVEMGRFKDISSPSGIKHKGEESYAQFTDYDNDGWFDLLIINDGEPLLYKSIDQGEYKDVSKKAFPIKIKNASKALYLDMDHEGDLDLLLLTDAENHLLRNNSDGTFGDYSLESGISGIVAESRDANFGDYDDDGDIDLIIANANAECEYYTNVREGKFRDISKISFDESTYGASSVETADYNNDGQLDLFFSGFQDGSLRLFLNKGDGTFNRDYRSKEVLNNFTYLTAMDAIFFDFDNDGYQDLFICGSSNQEGLRGACLLHNNSEGVFVDVSHLLPEGLPGGQQVAIGDFNEDNDLDIYLARLNGGVQLLRNDGGNVNHQMKIRLVGVRSGSGKNNHYGIGARIELKSGDLYQMKVVTEPFIQFGLGNREDVDVVRILWTNGTPQNIFDPGIEQDLIEEQQLKGSCPFLYTWNGSEYEFVKDIMWRSALGMPMGIMAGEQKYAFANASEDYLKIPGKMLVPKNGKYSIQVTEELWETIYLDEVQLLAVDHPDSIDVFVDEKFAPPPYPPLKILPVSNITTVKSAFDGKGNNMIEQIKQKDNNYVSNFIKSRFQGIIEPTELILDPGELKQTDNLYLFLNGWIFPTDASINLALSQGDNEIVRAPYLQVLNKEGIWVTAIENIGFPEGKNKTIITDISEIFLSDDHRVRICTNMEIYWDYAFFSETVQESTFSVTYLDPISADHHYRGFSKMYRLGGRYGPHWFDYSSVNKDQKWRDLTGSYTRFGDVHELLKDSDDFYIIANAGEETTIEFSADELEELPVDWTRDFIIYSVGWVKDGDMNTAEGNRVDPLPFHGMTHYPYGDEQSYPTDKKHRDYLNKYNTRTVNNKSFKEALTLNKK